MRVLSIGYINAGTNLKGKEGHTKISLIAGI